VAAGFLAGIVAAIAMTLAMLLLAWKLRIATPLVIVGDRLSVFISPKAFFWIMGRVGGYNHLKQLGVCSTALAQLLIGGLGGMFYGVFQRTRHLSWGQTAATFILLPLVLSAIVLWPVLGTHYGGLPIDAARITTLLGLALCFLVFERVLVVSYGFLTSKRSESGEASPEFTPTIGRRLFLLSIAGILLSGGVAAVARKLFKIATFSYDGTQYKGPAVEPITPNELFYCVTKNIVDPRVNVGLWHLEISGLVQNPRTYRMQDLRAMGMVDQETTLMCISNGLDAGLMSNAIWRGIPMPDLLQTAGPLSGAARVKLHGVDNYSDTFPLEKALEATTLVAFEMNGEILPYRHGFPARAIVPGYFGEKHVKWLTRIELTGPQAKGFYETQGWGPDFIVPTRSRIDLPANESWYKLGDVAHKGIGVNGVAFAGDRGISRVEVSFDDGDSWDEAQITYVGTKLTWVLWRYNWKPDEVADYVVVVRATDGEGELQEFEGDREFTSGITGFHRITVHVYV
jgi:DMSO/TMAO reductase YedYZ molybdopterin-dependent catalytic subunit